MTHLQLLDEAVARHNDAEWSRQALELIRNDQRRSADTHLLRLDCRCSTGSTSISRTNRPIPPAA